VPETPAAASSTTLRIVAASAGRLDEEGGVGQLDGHLDPEVSRWLWLVKWFLAIPHFLALALLWPS
jgi:hypothetical protein